ncbi:hypothetical protein ACR71G_20875 [Xenorhabdus bovienii]|uniref:hypothetical protein n=1 Tax=Xenorhabdus bovienii TaxID=40576 RepID=UPI003DA496DD
MQAWHQQDARGRKGGRPYKMTPIKLRLAIASMGRPETIVSTLCQELGIISVAGKIWDSGVGVPRMHPVANKGAMLCER